MKILLLGADGQVGWELQRSLAPLGELSRWRCGRDGGRLRRSPTRWPQTVRALRPDVIVNAAAYTAVDKAESEPELRHADQRRRRPACWRARPRALGAWLVHFSTDYVFDGSGDRAARRGRADRRR